MAKVNDIPEMTAEDYAKLPPLVKKGEDREAKIEEIVTGWCTSKGEWHWDEHVNNGGYLLERVALVDENTGEPIDLAELVRRVEERLQAEGAPAEFEERGDLHIILRNCRVDACNCRELKIRPRWMCHRVAFGHNASFSFATFGSGATFESCTFGDRTDFESATFDDLSSFNSTTFGNEASFARATFAYMGMFVSATFGWQADFHHATFGTLAGFAAATFGDRAMFDFATFGNHAKFRLATFANVPSFCSTTFGADADFDSATFGGWATFESAAFGPGATFLNTRFAAAGGTEGAAVGRPARGLLGLRRMGERLSRWFDWMKVRSLGRLQILTRVSYVALVLVPLLAGGWPAVRAVVNWVNDDVRAAAREFDAVADRIENLRADLPPALTEPDDVVQKMVTQIRRVEDQLGGRSLEERDLPLGWVLAFFAALFVALGHLLYQLAADEKVRERSREAFVAARNDEFRQCSEGQRRDLLTRAFPWLRQIADALPGFRGPTLVSRHGHTVWIPPNLEVLNRVGETSEAPETDATKAQADADADAESPQAPEPAASSTESKDRTGEAEKPGHERESKRLIKFTRGELELIVVDEGARAEYDVAAREQIRRAVVAGVLYSYGVLFIAWLVMLQAERVLLQAGLLGDPDTYNLLTPRVFVPLAVGVTGLYVIAGVVWLIVRLVTAVKRRGGE